MENDKPLNYTHQEALIAEMLGDVLQLDAAVEKLSGTFPAQTQAFTESIEAVKVDAINSIKKASKESANSIVVQLKEHQNDYQKQILEYTNKLGKDLSVEFAKQVKGTLSEINKILEDIKENQSNSTKNDSKQFINIIIPYALGLIIFTVLLNLAVTYTAIKFIPQQTETTQLEPQQDTKKTKR